jgi:hypothetical protein
MGIQVIQDTGIPVTPAASVIRNFLRIADFLPMLYATGLISMMCNREFKRLGDLAAGTLVVYRDDKRERVRPPSEKVEKPPLELCEEDQLTLLAFSERAEELSAERREELAGLLSEARMSMLQEVEDFLNLPVAMRERCYQAVGSRI